MKIVINALSARMGGGQTYLKNLLAYLPEQVDILVYAPRGLTLPTDPKIRCATPFWPTDNPLLRTVWEKFALPLILRKEKAQILFCPGGIITSPVPFGCQTVTMFRNMMPFSPEVLDRMPFGLQKIRNFILKRVMLCSMAQADLTIFISEYARSVIENLTPVKNAVTIYHGINPQFRTAGQTIHRPYWVPEGGYLLYVSRFDVYKHQMEVVQAYAELPVELRDRYKLLLIGETDSPLAQDVAAWVKQKGLDAQVIIKGAVPYAELPAVYHHAAVNLFASSCENCPNIMLEALGAGRPVLSSSVMPMPEFGAGFVDYFSPTDPLSICQSLLSVLQNEAERENLARLAQQRSSDFDWQKTAELTWHHIGLLLKVKPVPDLHLDHCKDS